MISLFDILRQMIRLDILPREVLILEELSRNPGICRTTLANNIGFKQSSSVYPALRRMIDRHWVFDHKSPLATRGDPSILFITANGRTVLSDINPESN